VNIEINSGAQLSESSAAADFAQALIKDGLIKGDLYSIRLSNDSLFINGNLMPADVLDTYAPLLKGAKKLQIEYSKESE
jgi:hypothetical protein